MKKNLKIGWTLWCFAMAQVGFCQLNPKIAKSIKPKIEAAILEFRTQMNADGVDGKPLEFQLDTFRIERTIEFAMEEDGSTAGMNIAIAEGEKMYDALLNKYYKKIMKYLTPKDQESLKAAQRAWVNFRDQELKLIGLLTKEAYSGGGTIQSNIASGRSFELTRARAIALANYWIEMAIE